MTWLPVVCGLWFAALTFRLGGWLAKADPAGREILRSKAWRLLVLALPVAAAAAVFHEWASPVLIELKIRAYFTKLEKASATDRTQVTSIGRGHDGRLVMTYHVRVPGHVSDGKEVPFRVVLKYATLTLEGESSPLAMVLKAPLPDAFQPGGVFVDIHLAAPPIDPKFSEAALQIAVDYQSENGSTPCSLKFNARIDLDEMALK